VDFSEPVFYYEEGQQVVEKPEFGLLGKARGFLKAQHIQQDVSI
jgi:hypothetical protein